ncbi:MAG: NAD(+)/NADH kinase [Clostridia bacterium]|nr:NAD(+)/NADH kinase [Clostridia bacterium]
MKLGLAFSKKHKLNDMQPYLDCLNRVGVDYCLESQSQDFDMLMSFGGDGTTLFYGKIYAGIVPLVPVNMGKVGFISQIDRDIKSFESSVKLLKKGKYTLSQRSLLSISVNDSQQFTALNELLICNSNRGNTIALTVNINGDRLDKLTGDGALIATPTGSTGYCSSLGGPTLMPDTECLVYMAVASLTHSSPLVLNNTNVITVECTSANTCMYVDGILQELSCPCTVNVRLSDKRLSIVQLKDNYFYKLNRVGKIGGDIV